MVMLQGRWSNFTLRGQSSKGQRTIYNQGIKMYNRLQTEIKEAGSIGQFREAVGKWLKDMDYVIFQ